MVTEYFLKVSKSLIVIAPLVLTEMGEELSLIKTLISFVLSPAETFCAGTAKVQAIKKTKNGISEVFFIF